MVPESFMRSGRHHGARASRHSAVPRSSFAAAPRNLSNSTRAPGRMASPPDATPRLAATHSRCSARWSLCVDFGPGMGRNAARRRGMALPSASTRGVTEFAWAAGSEQGHGGWPRAAAGPVLVLRRRNGIGSGRRSGAVVGSDSEGTGQYDRSSDVPEVGASEQSIEYAITHKGRKTQARQVAIISQLHSGPT